jgi:hypothetical protein
MKKIVTLSLIAVATLSLAACKKTEVVNDTNVTDTNTVVTDTMTDTNAAADTNATAPADNASNAM